MQLFSLSCVLLLTSSILFSFVGILSSRMQENEEEEKEARNCMRAPSYRYKPTPRERARPFASLLRVCDGVKWLSARFRGTLYRSSSLSLSLSLSFFRFIIGIFTQPVTCCFLHIARGAELDIMYERETSIDVN